MVKPRFIFRFYAYLSLSVEDFPLFCLSAFPSWTCSAPPARTNYRGFISWQIALIGDLSPGSVLQPVDNFSEMVEKQPDFNYGCFISRFYRVLSPERLRYLGPSVAVSLSG